MARVKRGTTAHARHKKITDKAKGYYGRRKNVFRVAVQAVEKAGHMRIAIGKSVKEHSGGCGFNASTLVLGSMD